MKPLEVDRTRVIHIEPAAPSKPALGEPCNGCGLCCLAEPCPVGIVFSLRRSGACRLLQWDGVHQRYLCGALGRAQTWPRWCARLLTALLKRWIAAGAGCDAAWEAQPPR